MDDTVEVSTGMIRAAARQNIFASQEQLQAYSQCSYPDKDCIRALRESIEVNLLILERVTKLEESDLVVSCAR